VDSLVLPHSVSWIYWLLMQAQTLLVQSSGLEPQQVYLLPE
jgi:hypothetical protein